MCTCFSEAHACLAAFVQVARAKVAKQQRTKVLASLAATALPAEAAQLLHHSADRGQRPTKRQRLRRELLAQRLGVTLQVCFLPAGIWRGWEQIEHKSPEHKFLYQSRPFCNMGARDSSA